MINRGNYKIENTNNTFDATPSYKLLDTMGYGTYSIQTAIADIVDNSITAGATFISIRFEWNDGENSYVEIEDNGCGMSSSELENAMIFSSKGINDERKENDLGKYGLGMKTASMYACKCLTVISKKEGHKITAKRLDRDLVDENKAWIGVNLDGASELDAINLTQGTIVRWDKLSFTEKAKKSKNYFFKYVDDVRKHLELIFHRFIENDGLVIEINGNRINPWNPACNHPATTKFDSQKLSFNGSIIEVKSYLMPSALKCDENVIKEIYRGDALKHQGFYVYRNNRILIEGGWLNIHYGNSSLSTHQSFNSVRIIVDIPSSLDSIFKVDFTKSSLKFPIELEEQLYKIANKVRKKAKELSKKRFHTPIQTGEKLEEIWKIRKKEDEYSYSINKSHPIIKKLTKDMDKKDFNELMSILAKTVPFLSDERKFTGTFTVEEMDKLIQSYYLEQYLKNKGMDSIYNEMHHMEPFNQYGELVNAFFEKLRTQTNESNEG